ncbi:MAG TPA: hypothetical protein VIG99_22300 [Myxococcaceae bacterium]|jgi:hypothetical protein
MPKTNNVTRGVAAAGLLAAFAQLAVAQPAQAGEQPPQVQVQAQPPSQEQQVKESADGRDGLVGLIQQFYDRLFDSQNN